MICVRHKHHYKACENTHMIGFQDTNMDRWLQGPSKSSDSTGSSKQCSIFILIFCFFASKYLKFISQHIMSRTNYDPRYVPVSSSQYQITANGRDQGGTNSKKRWTDHKRGHDDSPNQSPFFDECKANIPVCCLRDNSTWDRNSSLDHKSITRVH
jgi:hypothetical protein